MIKLILLTVRVLAPNNTLPCFGFTTNITLIISGPNIKQLFNNSKKVI
jgi:hypothetical protein